MRDPRIIQKSAVWIAGAIIIATLGYVAMAADSTRAEKIPAAVDAAQYADFMANEALDIPDLAEAAESQREMFNRMTPPDHSWRQPMFPAVVPFAAANFADSFLGDLLGEDKNSVTVYPLSLVMDPKTRETVIYNAEGKRLATIPADKTSRVWPKDADPARVTLLLDLLPAEDAEPYLYVENRLAGAAVSSGSKQVQDGGPARRSLGPGQFGICHIQTLTNGFAQITVTNAPGAVEIFAYTVLHAASNVVVSNDTLTLWTPMSPSFNGLEGSWECQATNLALTNGVGVWEDANISSNARVRFYAAANRVDTDDDGLTDGAELFVHHTPPGDADTDGDGLTDGEEIVERGTDPVDADTDKDGMPDGWEVLHLFNPISGPTARLDWFRFDEGTGVAVRTTSGSFTGVLLNAAATNWVRGHTGGSNDFALWFDGTNDYVSVPTNLYMGSIITQAPFSVSAWVFQTAAPTGQYATLFSDSSWVTNHFGGYLFRKAGAGSHSFYVGSPTNHGYCYGSVASGRWVHLVGTYNGTNMQLYVDGAFSAAGICKPFQPVKGGLWLGRGHVNPGESYWKGVIDDVRFYGCAMTAQDVASLYEPFADADSDGLSNLAESEGGTNPRNPDTDGDDLSDGDEVNGYGTNPLETDTDGDTIPDGAEIDLGLNPIDAADAGEDPDDDHLVNREEYELNLPMDVSNEVTMVYFNPNPPAARRSLNGSGNVEYVTWDNLQAKALSTIRYKEGYSEFTDETLPPSDPPKWYLTREWLYEDAGEGMDITQHGDTHYRTHSETNYCFKEFDPNGWPTAPTNHVCTGCEHFLSEHSEDGCLRTRSGWDYSYSQPSANVPIANHYLHYFSCDDTSPTIINSTGFLNSCDMAVPLFPDIYSHTETYISNDWNDYLLAWDLEDPDAYQMEWETLANEYTDEMLLFYTQADLGLMPTVDGLAWGQRYAREDHRHEPYEEALPTNEIYSSYLISTNNDDQIQLQLQDLRYQWTISTTTGVTYKLMWLEAFRPQGGNTYTWFNATSTVFKGTGNVYTSGIYQAKFPWDMSLPFESGEPYGTVTPIGFLVQMQCILAETANMGFGIDPPVTPCYPVWDEEVEAAKSDQNKINSALTVFFKNASTPEGDPEDFDVTLRVFPDTLEGVYWSITADSPDSGLLLNADQPVATFRNPTKGGLYKFETTIPGIPTITSQLWLPVSGPDISANFQNEIDYLRNWKPRYLTNLHTRILASLGWYRIENQDEYNQRSRKLKREDIIYLGPNYDYVLISQSLIQDVCGLANMWGDKGAAGDSIRLDISSSVHKYVTDFSKRNNMGYAMCARAQGRPPWQIILGPNLCGILGYNVGTSDDEYAVWSYWAGIDLMDGKTLSETMDTYGLKMQHPASRTAKEWPSDVAATTSYIVRSTNVIFELEKMAGGNP